ncbi:hypothetical protein Zmor_024156 [Zophobas morio]|uniref:Reverse transcriptase domain-containing protein n=1 Tax=Zophobas morio TaxID=2755281 RepID=A0AA38I2B6_9CUCU|nr:hypothetical protein Zmor_024156 [Zophobas morio]
MNCMKEWRVSERANYDEIERSVRSLRKKKSPGMDGVTPQMMAVVWKTVPEYVLEVFNACMGVGGVPDEWKVPRLVILLKGMDKGMSLRRSYRPILKEEGRGLSSDS